MYTLTVKITKELIEKSKMCGYTPAGNLDYDEEHGLISENCLFALAFRDIFPKAVVSSTYIFPFGIGDETHFESPKRAQQLIEMFDNLTPQGRVMNIQEEEIEIPIPDEVINQLDISEITQQLSNHPTLKLLEV